jgi:hypothetical protein
MNKIIAALAVLCILLSSCRHNKALTKAAPNNPAAAKEVSSINELRSFLKSVKPDFNWMRVRANITYEDPGKKYSANTNLKLRKDSLIWGSVSLILELARIEVTNDSAVMLNRANRQFNVYRTADLQQLLEMQGLNVTSLQHLLEAYPPFPISDDAKIGRSAGADQKEEYNVVTQTPTYKETMEIDSKTGLLKTYRYDRNNTQYVIARYSDFTDVDNKLNLPKKIELEIRTPDKIMITLDVSDYALLDADETPFNIPASYTRAH